MVRWHGSTLLLNQCVKSLQCSFHRLLSFQAIHWHDAEDEQWKAEGQFLRGNQIPTKGCFMAAYKLPFTKTLGLYRHIPQPNRFDHGYQYVRQLNKWFKIANTAWTKVFSGETSLITAFVVPAKFPQQAICSSCNSIHIYNLLQRESFWKPKQKNKVYVKRYNGDSIDNKRYEILKLSIDDQTVHQPVPFCAGRPNDGSNVCVFSPVL